MGYDAYLKSAPRFLVAAGDDERRALVAQVRVEFLSRQWRRVATVRARHGSARACGVVRAQCVRHELLGAVPTTNEPLHAVVCLVRRQQAPLDLHAALVFAVGRLVTAVSRVILATTATVRL